MSVGIRFSVFSSNPVHGSGREILGARALVDVLEDRRLLSATVEEGLLTYEGTAGAVESALNAEVDPSAAVKQGGLKFDKGSLAAVEVGGVNGPQTFSAARIDDGSGRDNLHRSGAALEWIEPMKADDSASLLMAPANVTVVGRFSTGRVLTGNMSPVATMSIPGAAQVFAA